VFLFSRKGSSNCHRLAGDKLYQCVVMACTSVWVWLLVAVSYTKKDHPAIYRGVLDLELGEGWWLHCYYKHVWSVDWTCCGASMHAWKARMHAKQKFFNCVLATQLRRFVLLISL